MSDDSTYILIIPFSILILLVISIIVESINRIKRSLLKIAVCTAIGLLIAYVYWINTGTYQRYVSKRIMSHKLYHVEMGAEECNSWQWDGDYVEKDVVVDTCKVTMNPFDRWEFLVIENNCNCKPSDFVKYIKKYDRIHHTNQFNQQ